MARKYEKCILHAVKYRNTSMYGNPSYWVYFTDSEGNFYCAYTGSNASAGYCIGNYAKRESRIPIYLCYHFTKKGACVIDSIKHVTPDEAIREAEEAVKN